MFADCAASIADEAADIAAPAAAEAPLSAGVVTTVVVDGAVVAGGVVVVVVVVSSFLVQAAKETAAASVTINRAVFIFLLDLGFVKLFGQSWEPSERSPIREWTRKAQAFQCQPSIIGVLRVFPRGRGSSAGSLRPTVAKARQPPRAPAPGR